MYGWLTFYHQGHEVAKDFKPHMTELQSRIQKVSMQLEFCTFDETQMQNAHDVKRLCLFLFFRPVKTSTLVEMTYTPS